MIPNPTLATVTAMMKSLAWGVGILVALFLVADPIDEKINAWFERRRERRSSRDRRPT